MRLQNLEQFLEARGLNYKAVVGPRWEGKDAEGKLSEDRFYIINSSLDTVKSVRSVWKKGTWSLSVSKTITELDLHETKMIYSHDIKEVKRTILAEGVKAYEAYLIREARGKGDEQVETDKLNKEFQKIIKDLKK